MTRVKRGTTSKRRHKKVLSRTKGFRMTRNSNIKVAREADLHAGQYAYVGRKLRKRDMRRAWILRIGQALRLQDWNYSQFINAMHNKKIELNRKTLAMLVREHPDVFAQVVKEVRK